MKRTIMMMPLLLEIVAMLLVPRAFAHRMRYLPGDNLNSGNLVRMFLS